MCFSFNRILLLLLATASTAGAYSTVNFTLSLSSADSGLTLNNFQEGEKGFGDTFAVAFNTSVTAIDGTPVTPGPIASFCTELEEGIGIASYTFTSHDLSDVSAGRAGQSGTASIGIPAGGIGDLRAARVRYLFDNYYQNTSINLWTITQAQPRTHAFQLALWEITHDSDLSLSLTTGHTWIGAQSTTQATNAVSLATGWLNGLAAANVTTAYTSTTYDVWTLVSTTGNAASGFGYQDVLFATPLADSRKTTFTQMSTIPEPGSASLLLAAGLALPLRRGRVGRRRCVG